MQENIHPKYEDVNVVCSCGNKFSIGSTLGQKDLHVEVCNKCHPFYTGDQKIVDTQGRVDSFATRFGNFGALARKKKE
jgi:large subunit ribosomal protein L31